MCIWMYVLCFNLTVFVFYFQANIKKLHSIFLFCFILNILNSTLQH